MGAPASTVTVRGSSESDALTYTASVQEDMERQRRVATFHAVAGELLQQALGIKEHAGAGRPSLKTVRLRVVRGVLLTALCGDPSVDKEAPLNSASLHKWLSLNLKLPVLTWHRTQAGTALRYFQVCFVCRSGWGWSWWWRLGQGCQWQYSLRPRVQGTGSPGYA